MADEDCLVLWKLKDYRWGDDRCIGTYMHTFVNFDSCVLTDKHLPFHSADNI